jgi:hypothetical protein
LLAWLVGNRLQAQTVTFDKDLYMFVIGTAGNSDTVKRASGEVAYFVDWTIGEILVGDRKGSKKWLSQGFHQGLKERLSDIQKSTHIFSVLDQDNTRHFTAFPNPFANYISIKWNFEENINLLFEVFTLEGRRVHVQRQNAMNSQLLIQLNNLKPSTYILRISDPSRNFYESHKIVKF